MLGFVALGVDLGALYFRQKTLQTHADLAAISAVNNLSTQPADHALVTVLGNGLDAGAMTSVTFGHYQRDLSVPIDDRLTDRALTAPDVNAATVQLQEAAPLYFARTFLQQETTQLGATATAARFDLASFSLGSRLGAVNEGVLNALLSEAIGSSVSLNLLDYESLLDTNIDLLTFADALATRADLTALTYEELLSSDIELLDIAGALLDTGAVQGSTAVLDAVLSGMISPVIDAEKLIAIDGDDVAVQLGDVLPTVTVKAFDILFSSLDIVNENRFIETSLNLNVPNLLATDVTLVVGERPAWIVFGEKGATAHTAQVRMKLDLTLDTNILSGILPLLDVVSVELPVYLEIASATVTLTDLDCGAADDEIRTTFDVGIDPLVGVTGTHVAELFLGNFPVPDFEDTTTPLDQSNLEEAKMLGVNIGVSGLLGGLITVGLDVMVKSHASVGESEKTQEFFTRLEEGDTRKFGSRKMASSTVSTIVANASIDPVPTGTLGLLSSVLALAKETVSSLVTNLLAPILAAVLTPVDSVLDTVLETLGIGIGEADLTLHKAHCGRIVLVR
ncbi:TadG family pilus assembly protein [Pseudosulfitobacter pseudonitzschiae]|nr:TadG family pilus assembly protein [Pseudosulfitobacter pseudonitzschiae]MBM1849749.1 hypothetical protein [Pseudosulfitobacter pseudonitzschiae]MBM1932112.1 hypothetical protein [Pseudosulfitobacter pseudonitzschiae]MBM1965985.1 hypothetical protein [Pseudosulfitobacter pseudonitzschiae]MBM2135485.1 hypothetical protein [Pseudosulfitobacter pseudonitzschiae]MBM2197995.1 hypothetical protein [Pseudosulfitobacter pseudonitzschiae]